jgi:hypothetical protein
MESGPVPSTNSVYSATGGGQHPSQRLGKRGHTRMAQMIQRRFPRPTFHAAPVQHGEPPVSVADGGPPFRSRRHSDHRRILAVDQTEARWGCGQRKPPGCVLCPERRTAEPTSRGRAFVGRLRSNPVTLISPRLVRQPMASAGARKRLDRPTSPARGQARARGRGRVRRQAELVIASVPFSRIKTHPCPKLNRGSWAQIGSSLHS